MSNVTNATTCSCDGDTFVATVTGIPEAAEHVRLVEECYGKFTFKHAIWDFRASSLSGLPVETIREVAAASAKFADKRGPGAKTAYILRDESEFLMFRALTENIQQVSPVRFGAFYTMEDARTWLSE